MFFTSCITANTAISVRRVENHRTSVLYSELKKEVEKHGLVVER
jgi:hypothetical protein